MSTGGTKGRRERERERQRAEILEAARKLVERGGLGSLTVDEVAREAEFAVGSIYRHFRSKEELLELLVVHLAEPLGEALEELAQAPWTERRVSELVAAVVEPFADHVVLLRAYHLVDGPPPTESSPAKVQLARTRARWVAAVEQVLRSGQAAGALRAGDAREWATLLLAATIGWARWAAVSGSDGVARPAESLGELWWEALRSRSA